jgi:ADP-ribose pyrophosphatase YjhB (NUDIX family)
MIEKVSAFLFRKKGDRLQILLVRHPTAGYQIPAGTVEENEDLQDAVRREIREECGIKELGLIIELPETHQFLEGDEAILTKTMRLYSWPASSARRDGPLCRRGFLLKTFEKKVGFTRVKYQEFNLKKKPPALISELESWVMSDDLTREVRRHFFAFYVREETLDQWENHAEPDQVFTLKWVDMDAIPELTEGQNEWLDQLKGLDSAEIAELF